MKSKFDLNYFSRFKGGYDGILMRIIFFLKFRKALSLIRKYKKKGRLLDLGCAYGFFVDEAEKSRFNSFGSDVSIFALKNARKKFPSIKLVCSDIEKGLVFKPSSFDIVTAFDVLEHCKNLSFVLEEIRRVLKKDGILLLTIPTKDFNQTKEDPTHVWHLWLEEWIKILEEKNFKILKISRFLRNFSWLNKLIVMNFILCKKFQL
ncbi:MAG: class I SAM-dependent methyltransferase [Candidatus Aenigmatarchaeota archaeon]